MKKSFRPKKLLSRREKQFWQPFRNLFAKQIRTFDKTFQFGRRKFPKNVPLDTSIEVLTTMLESFRKSQLSLRSNFKKDEPRKNFNFFFFTGKRCSGHAESCFEKHAYFFRKNSISFRSTLEKDGKVYKRFEGTIFLQNAAFDT